MTAALDYLAPAPRCPEHGVMAWHARAGLWICPGRDGNGCGHVADWPPMGYAASFAGAETVTVTGDRL